MKYIFGSWKKGWKITTLIAVGVVVLASLHFGEVVNLSPKKLLGKKPLTERQQVAKDSLRRVDSIATVQAKIAKAQKDSMAVAAQEVATPKEQRKPLTLAVVFSDSWFWWVVILSLVGAIVTAYFSGKTVSGLATIFAGLGKGLFWAGVLYLISFAFYMRNQKVQKIPFYADDTRIRWVIDSTALRNPKQVVYAPDTASFRIIDSLTRELLVYQRDNIAVQTEQAKTIDSLMVVISDQSPVEEPVVSKPKEVEKKTVPPEEEKKKDPVVVKKKKKPSARVAVRDTKTKVYAPGSSGLSRSVE